MAMGAAPGVAGAGGAMAASLEDLFGGEPPGGADEPTGDARRALVVAAHPDDADFGAAGTVALLADAGWSVRYVVVTSGSKGSEDRTLTPEQLVEMRRAEQEKAARLLGVHSVGFLGFPDGELGTGRELLGAITREIRSFHPFAVYTHDPEPVILENSFVNHSDHRATGLATVDAVYPAARDHLNFPEQIAEGLETHRVRELYLFGTHAPNQTVDITTVLDTKIAALAAHVSQFTVDDDFRALLRERWSEEDGRYVERFRRVRLWF